MARLPYLDVDDLAPENRDLLKRDINLNRILAHSPTGLRHFTGLAQWIRFDSNLNARLRELAILQVGYLTKSPYEYSHHLKICRDFGVSDDDIRALIAESAGEASGLPELDRAVLRAAREMSEGLELSDATFAVLRAELSDEHLVDLLLIISIYCGLVRLLGALQIDVEPSYQPHLDEFPLD